MTRINLNGMPVDLDADTAVVGRQRGRLLLRRTIFRTVVDDTYCPSLELVVRRPVVERDDSLVESDSLWEASLEPTTSDVHPTWCGSGVSQQDAVDSMWKQIPAKTRNQILEWCKAVP